MHLHSPSYMPFSVTIGVLVVGAVAMNIGLPYSDVIGMFYMALSGALACRVFRMLILCRWEMEDTDISTRVIEDMVMAVMARAEAQGAATVREVECDSLI